jgi:hypothetical protein
MLASLGCPVGQTVGLVWTGVPMNGSYIQFGARILTLNWYASADDRSASALELFDVREYYTS